MSVDLELNGFIPTEEGIEVVLSSDSPFDYNTIEDRNKIEIKESKIDSFSPNMVITLQPHSLTILKLKKE
ncbi:MAG: hypothetical protein ACXAB8_11255 [Promethearchaeota archaeon]|jgi:alpha-L-arabinofuranosidase